MQQGMPLLLALLSFFFSGALAACSLPSTTGFQRWSTSGLATNDPSATITLTQNMLLDQNITLNTLIVDTPYKLVVDVNKDVIIRVRMIYVNTDAQFWIGGEGCPYTKNAEIIFTGPWSASDALGFGDKGMGVYGTVEWHGIPTNPTWTHLTSTAQIGAKSINVADSVAWKVGSQIIIASTDFDEDQSEVVTITQITNSGNTIKFAEPLQFMHWGAQMNYIDQRAEVGLLTKNIKVHGEIDPNDPNTIKGPKFGGHTMYQEGSTGHIENVQFYAMGQAGMLARYPVHFHAAFDMTGSYVKECAFVSTFQRCITIHASHNILIKDNVAYNSNGHCYFWEDGIEHGNIADHNLGVIANVVTDANLRIIPSDQTQTSVFWITHPNNTLMNNVAVGGVFGFWYALPKNPIGLSGQAGQDLRYWARYSGMGQGEFINNKAHSQSKTGLFVDQGPAPNGDTSQLNSYTCRDFTLDEDWAQTADPTALEAAILDMPRSKPAKFMNFMAHHCVENAAWLRGDNMIVDGLISADCQAAITMPGGPNLIQNAIIIGDTPNPGNPSNKAAMQGRSRWYSWNVTYPMQGLRHYDCCGPNFMRNILFVNFTDFQYVFTGDKRKTGAVTFLNGDHPIPPNTRFWNIKFEDVTNRVYYLPDSTFRTALKYAFLVDGDGSFTGKCGSVIAPNNPILLRPQCDEVYSWNGYVCPPGTISPRYIEAADAGNFGANTYLTTMTGTVDLGLDNYPNSSSTGTGVGRMLVIRVDDQANNWISGPETWNNGTHVMYNMNYRQNLPSQTEYLFVFPTDYGTPKQLRIQSYNMPLGEWFRVVVPYPSGTTFVPRNVSSYLNEPAINCNDNVNYPQWGNCPFTQVNSKSALVANSYFWDDAKGLLWLQIQSTSQSFSNSFGYSWPSASPAAVITATCPNNNCRVDPSIINDLVDYANPFWSNPTPYTPPRTNLCYTNGYANAGKKQYSELGDPYVLFDDSLKTPWQLPTWSFNSSTVQSTMAVSGSALQMFLNPWNTFQIRTPWNQDFGLGNITNPGVANSELALIFDVRMGAVPTPLNTYLSQHRDVVNIIAAVWETAPRSRSWSISVNSPYITGGSNPIDSTQWYHVVVPWSQFPGGGIPDDLTNIVGVGIGVSEAFQSTIFVDNVKLQYVSSSFSAQSMPAFTPLTTHKTDALSPLVPVDALTSGCMPCGLSSGGGSGDPCTSSSSSGFDGKAGAILVFALLFAASTGIAIYFYWQLHQKQQIPQLESGSTSP